jgi:hypothetical protein
MALKDIRPALSAFLLGDAAIATAVGTRVYPQFLPQNTTVASIVYQKISDVGNHSLSGPTRLARPRFQIDAWAPTNNGANALALLIKERLDGYQGVMGSGGDAVDVQGVFYENARELYDESAKLHRVSADYFIAYDEQ